MKILNASILLILSFFLFFCCKPSKDSTDPKTDTQTANREIMLKFWADEIIIPSYENYKIKVDSLKIVADSFALKPNQSTLNQLISSWESAYISWQKIELFDVGPANSVALRNFSNIYPANTLTINSKIAAEDYNLEFSTTYPAQGYPALDYLLNGLSENQDSVLLYYTTKTDYNKRLNYLKSVVNQLNSKFNSVYDSWKSTYRDEFIKKTDLTISGSTSAMVNAYVYNYESSIRASQIGYPSGAFTNVVAPSKLEALYKKDLGKKLVSTSHQASVDFFNGKSVKTGQYGYSLSSYLNALDAKDSKTGQALSSILVTQFETVNTKISALNPQLVVDVNTNNQKMLDVFDAMQTAVRMLKVDMTSQMSITITYSDNDGD